MPTPKLVDSHCHLDADYAGKPVSLIVSEAHTNDVAWMVSVATDAITATEVQAIAEAHENVFFSVGIHPHESARFDLAAVEAMKPFYRHKKCVAVGEIGLDYFYNHSAKEPQIEIFRAQLALAREVGKPVIIHCRDAEADTLKELEVYAKGHSGQMALKNPGVIHCFTGTKEFGQACLDLGFYISFSGIITFKNAEPLRECARVFPIERLLVETDSPFLAPTPFRGRKCEPAMVKMTALKLAEIKGLDFETLARHTSQNSAKLFGLTSANP